MKPHYFLEQLAEADLAPAYGRVRGVAAGLVRASGPASAVGDLVDIESRTDEGTMRVVSAEVAAIDMEGIVLVPLDHGATIDLGAKVATRPQQRGAPVGDGFAGRAVNALGQPIDGGPVIPASTLAPFTVATPRPMERADPSRILVTGIRAIDGLLTLGVGQRVGVFAASGVGKTSLIEQLATQVEADRCIMCLVGERGREVEALWRTARAGKKADRFTLVAATSDDSAALRVRAVNYALCLANHWRARGEHVVLIVDSITRLAMALREVGLAAGAPPTVRAYTPNVFAALPRVVEQCGGIKEGGAITAIMTVLSETDDVDDPITEVMKSLLDGHIVLSRTLAEQSHFPAIDVLRSVSRQSERLVSRDQAAAGRAATALLATYDEARIMIDSGVYKAGGSGEIDRAIAARSGLQRFLRQERGEACSLAETLEQLGACGGGQRSHA